MATSFEGVKLKEFDCLILMNELRRRSIVRNTFRRSVRALLVVLPIALAVGGLLLSLIGVFDLKAAVFPAVGLFLIAFVSQVVVDCVSDQSWLMDMSREFGRMALGFGALAGGLDGEFKLTVDEKQQLDVLEQDFYAAIRKIEALQVPSIYLEKRVLRSRAQIAL